MIFHSNSLKITGQADNDGTENVEIMVPLKYLINFWKTLQMSSMLFSLILTRQKQN